MALPFQDNSVPFAASRVTTKAGTQTYVAERIVFNFPTVRIDRKDQIGKPNGFVLVPGQPTGTCTLQVATSAQAYAVLGDILENWQDLPTGGPWNLNPGAWVIESIGTPFAQGTYYVIEVTMVQAVFTSS